ncbi:MAG TPA: hypothetical protein VMG12_00940 [Polyangiaceae bacterium]|nr:hypothetical protein [Polyangiaceae bacterium]
MLEERLKAARRRGEASRRWPRDLQRNLLDVDLEHGLGIGAVGIDRFGFDRVNIDRVDIDRIDIDRIDIGRIDNIEAFWIGAVRLGGIRFGRDLFAGPRFFTLQSTDDG